MSFMKNCDSVENFCNFMTDNVIIKEENQWMETNFHWIEPEPRTLSKALTEHRDSEQYSKKSK